MVRSYQIQGLESKIFGLKYGVHHSVDPSLIEIQIKSGGHNINQKLIGKTVRGEFHLLTEIGMTNSPKFDSSGTMTVIYLSTERGSGNLPLARCSVHIDKP